ncbi:hypothetical protein [Schleiferilactobacillus harbinensis]|uniref:hypothetical protein n=1 Tax=Schleiferilactobacillus harbinensis TaxID=304207 RepID=UPI0011757170|nr:hypothetical protein [Schleiferilactobacillus harbinensis]GEK07512.1 hypothetical protein LHA01_27510 [Schleiferilactobacillus harbinensis]
MIQEGQFYIALAQITGFDIYVDECEELIVCEEGDVFQVYEHAYMYCEENDSVDDLTYIVTPRGAKFQVSTEDIATKVKRISKGTYKMALHRYPTIPEGPFD